jgi:hypothetical protein
MPTVPRRWEAPSSSWARSTKKFRREGNEVEVLGLNEGRATIVDRLAMHDKPGALERMLEH